MRALLKILLIAAITYFTTSFLPWYGIMIIAFVINLLLPGSSLEAFNSSFMAAFLLWAITSLIIHNSTEGLLSDKIAQLVALPNGLILVLVSSAIGGLATGFSGLSGNRLRSLFAPPKKRKNKIIV